MSLSVTLQFDTYEERTNVRDKWVRKIEKLTLMTGDLPKDGTKASKSDKQKFRPPTILFIWGRFSFKGVVESLSQKYTMFLSDGTPVRAECALKIRNVLDKNMDDDKSQSSSAEQAQSVAGRRQRPARSHRRQAARRRRPLGRDRRHTTTSSMPATSPTSTACARPRSRCPRTKPCRRRISIAASSSAPRRCSGDEVHDVLVECDLDQPDHCIVTLSNLSTKYSEQITEGDDLEVKLGVRRRRGPKSRVFKGEVVGIEPIYDARSPARVHIRGYNQLHRLMRGKKSVDATSRSPTRTSSTSCASRTASPPTSATPRRRPSTSTSTSTT